MKIDPRTMGLKREAKNALGEIAARAWPTAVYKNSKTVYVRRRVYEVYKFKKGATYESFGERFVQKC
jgi:hypothetical protein